MLIYPESDLSPPSVRAQKKFLFLKDEANLGFSVFLFSLTMKQMNKRDAAASERSWNNSREVRGDPTGSCC